MRYPLLPALLAGLGLALYLTPAVPAGGRPSAAEVRRLIEQLGSTSFNEREVATAALDAAGEAALPDLRVAAESEDAEVRRRAGELVRRIEQRVETDHLTAPTKIKLAFKDTPLRDAVAELCRQSHYTVSLQDPKGKLKDRKVTLNAEGITFWEALERLCVAAHLGENEEPTPQVEAIDVAARAFPPAAVPAPAVPGGLRNMSVRPVPTVNQINLVDSTQPEPATTHLGSMRIRGQRKSGTGRGAGPISLDLTVAAEPKVRFQEYFTLRLDKVIDDQGQELAPIDEPAPSTANVIWRTANPYSGGYTLQHLATRLTPGEKEARALKEVRGTLTARLFTEPRPVMCVDEILSSAGKTFAGSEGGSIKVLESVKDGSGHLTLKFELDLPQDLAGQAVPVGPARVRGPIRAGAIPAGGVPVPITTPAAGTRRVGGLNLLDEKGNAISASGMQLNARRGPAGLVREYSMEFNLPPGRAASKLVYEASKAVGIEVPFTLKDVSLK